LIGHAAVREAGVVGSRDAEGLEKTMAFVELATGHEASDALAEQLIEHCRSVLAGFKVPRRLEFVAELPRTETGKIRRAALRELASSSGGRA
jgi:benzoate-CoA ligase